MEKQKVLDRINDIIVDEKGQPVTMADRFIDSKLDSLGTMITLVTLDSEFHLFEGMTEDEALSHIDVPTLTVRELVHKCRLSSTNT